MTETKKAPKKTTAEKAAADEAKEAAKLEEATQADREDELNLDSFPRTVTGNTAGAIVQASLAMLGYGGELDGEIGRETQRAIAAFQSDEGDTPTGVLTLAVWKKLSAAVIAKLDKS